MKVIDLIYGPNHRLDRLDRRAARRMGLRCQVCDRLVGDKHRIACPVAYERVDIPDIMPANEPQS